MCSKVTCRICKKATWTGCGNHVNAVMAGIPKSERCKGHTKAEIEAAKSNSWLGKLLGR